MLSRQPSWENTLVLCREVWGNGRGEPFRAVKKPAPDVGCLPFGRWGRQRLALFALVPGPTSFPLFIKAEGLPRRRVEVKGDPKMDQLPIPFVPGS